MKFWHDTALTLIAGLEITMGTLGLVSMVQTGTSPPEIPLLFVPYIRFMALCYVGMCLMGYYHYRKKRNQYFIPHPFLIPIGIVSEIIGGWGNGTAVLLNVHFGLIIYWKVTWIELGFMGVNIIGVVLCTHYLIRGIRYLASFLK